LVCHTTWLARDVFFVIALIFGAGGLVYMLRDMKIKQNDVLARLGKIEQRLARLEGRVNTYHEGGD